MLLNLNEESQRHINTFILSKGNIDHGQLPCD